MINRKHLEFVTEKFLDCQGSGIEINTWVILKNDIYISYDDWNNSYSWDGASVSIPIDYYYNIVREYKLDILLEDE
jgi:hypothetical protein